MNKKEKRLIKLQTAIGEKLLATKWQRMVDGDWEIAWDENFLNDMRAYYREVHQEYDPSELDPLEYAVGELNKDLKQCFADYNCYFTDDNFWECLTTKELNEFIKAGADVNAKGDNHDWTLLHFTAEETLGGGLMGKPVCHPNGWTPLHWTAEQACSAGIIGGLVCLGADINAKNDDSWTPLHVAVKRNRNIEVIKELVNAGADIHARDNDGWTPLHVAARECWNDSIISTIKELINAGADVNVKDDYGLTPLHVAARERWNDSIISIITELIKAGADVNAKDNDDWTPLHIAAAFDKSVEVIKELVKAGADIRAENNDRKMPYEKLRNNDALRDDEEAIALLTSSS